MKKNVIWIGVILVVLIIVFLFIFVGQKLQVWGNSNDLLKYKLITIEGGNFVDSANLYEGNLIFENVENKESYFVFVCSDDWLWVQLNACYKINVNEVERNIKEHKYSAELSGCFVGNLQKVDCPGQNNQTFICIKDSDCVIKDNSVDCPIVSHINDNSKYVQTIPPSHTECPIQSEVVPICLNGECKIRFDCTRCDLLKEKYFLCNNYSGGTYSYICNLLNECNC